MAYEKLLYKIREADCEDALALNIFGSSIPELDVGGAVGGFLSDAQIEDSILEGGIWMVLENQGRIVGFGHAKIGDSDRTEASACIVYLALHKDHRSRGHGTQLLNAIVEALKQRDVQHVYGWADPDSGVIDFMKKHGFARGKTCVWVDKRL